MCVHVLLFLELLCTAGLCVAHIGENMKSNYIEIRCSILTKTIHERLHQVSWRSIQYLMTYHKCQHDVDARGRAMGSAWNFMAIHATLVEIFQSGPTNRVTLPSPVIATSTGGKEM